MVRDWAGVLMAVHCLDTLANILTGWERTLEAVHCLEASASTPSDCWTDCMNVPADCARVWRIRGWEIEQVAVHVLEAWVNSWRG